MLEKYNKKVIGKLKSYIIKKMQRDKQKSRFYIYFYIFIKQNC